MQQTQYSNCLSCVFIHVVDNKTEVNGRVPRVSPAAVSKWVSAQVSE